MELDLWVRAQKQDGVWEIVKRQGITPEKLQLHSKHLAQLFAGAAERGIPHSADFLDAGVETG